KELQNKKVRGKAVVFPARCDVLISAVNRVHDGRLQQICRCLVCFDHRCAIGMRLNLGLGECNDCPGVECVRQDLNDLSDSVALEKQLIKTCGPSAKIARIAMMIR